MLGRRGRRRGVQVAAKLTLADQPAEVSLLGNVIPANATIGLLTLSAQDVSPKADLTRVVGRAVEAKPAVLRAAQSGDVPGSMFEDEEGTSLSAGASALPA